MNSEKPINRPLNRADLEMDFPELGPLSFQMANFSETWHSSPWGPEIGFLGNCIVYSAVLHADGEVYQHKKLINPEDWKHLEVLVAVRRGALFCLLDAVLRREECKPL